MIREITGLGDTIQDFRILGTIMLVILVIIAFISTSIAIKTQFFILGAIALSLASIGLGFFTGDTSSQQNISLLPVADGVSLTTVFAIFFHRCGTFDHQDEFSGIFLDGVMQGRFSLVT